ncbi:MAG: cupin, partial [Calditrichaeota bacterium]
MKYYHQTQPTKIPTTDGKIIEEHLGLASSGHGEFSVAHMIAP